MGGAQPLAVTMAGGVFLGVESMPRASAAAWSPLLDEVADDLDDALRRCAEWQARKQPRSIALCANAADVFSELARRAWCPISPPTRPAPTIPRRLRAAGARRRRGSELRARDPAEYVRRSMASMAVHAARCSTSGARAHTS